MTTGHGVQGGVILKIRECDGFWELKGWRGDGEGCGLLLGFAVESGEVVY